MKIYDYIVRLGDRELLEFMDNVQVILNNGLYEFRVVASAPSWAAQPGENAIYISSSTIAPNRLYFYINNTWNFIGWSGSGSLSLVDADGDTGITPEYTPDEDVLRFYRAGYFQMAVNTLGTCIATEYSLCVSGNEGGSKFLATTTDNYAKLYSGVGLTTECLRIEM